MKSKQKKSRVKNKKIRLGVNIDHAATLRQVRGNSTSYPNLLNLAKLIKNAGAEQVTIHLREDRRHIQDADVILLTKKRVLEINLEMAATSEMQSIAIANKPDWVCLVPEKRHELTTEGGLDLLSRRVELKNYIARLNQHKIKVSVFIDPDLNQIEAAAAIGAQACEFHTGHWVMAQSKLKLKLWKQMTLAARKCEKLGLIVNAGHGLDYRHTELITRLPFLNEVNIGHSVICYSLESGLPDVVKKFKKILNSDVRRK
jgi:pyridoxine 5-phosphate synthase